MPTSRINADDAAEWLASLQQVGEGWYRQVALAVKTGAPKALGMEPREFARQIGQRLIDPRQAIIDLHQEGHSQARIVAVLGVSQSTVHNVLIEAGLLRGRLTSSGGTATGRTKAAQETATGRTEDDDPQAEIDRLAAEVKGAEARRKREVADLKNQMNEVRGRVAEEIKKLRREAAAELTQHERERLSKEADAWVNEQTAKVIAGVAHLTVSHIISALEEATEGMAQLVQDQTLDGDAMRRIAVAYAAFTEEYNVGRMAVNID